MRSKEILLGTKKHCTACNTSEKVSGMNKNTFRGWAKKQQKHTYL
jgi:hypothetical protein